mmetsp:Transcript_4717/g.12093  ORF Transcript_4717/g.12093 Transcript_4717/m.12093 type:complete len:212 (+) Transcript_4717:1552-2187(+)
MASPRTSSAPAEISFFWFSSFRIWRRFQPFGAAMILARASKPSRVRSFDSRLRTWRRGRPPLDRHDSHRATRKASGRRAPDMLSCVIFLALGCFESSAANFSEIVRCSWSLRLKRLYRPVSLENSRATPEECSLRYWSKYFLFKKLPLAFIFITAIPPPGPPPPPKRLFRLFLMAFVSPGAGFGGAAACPNLPDDVVALLWFLLASASCCL